MYVHATHFDPHKNTQIPFNTQIFTHQVTKCGFSNKMRKKRVAKQERWVKKKHQKRHKTVAFGAPSRFCRFNQIIQRIMWVKDLFDWCLMYSHIHTIRSLRALGWYTYIVFVYHTRCVAFSSELSQTISTIYYVRYYLRTIYALNLICVSTFGENGNTDGFYTRAYACMVNVGRLDSIYEFSAHNQWNDIAPKKIALGKKRSKAIK